MEAINFKKYQGTGNDFIIIDLLNYSNNLNDKFTDINEIKRICNRNYGIGADGILLVLPSKNKYIAKMHIINPDGSTPEMCGNGIRCFVKYLSDYTNLVNDDQLVIETLAGEIRANIKSNNDIEINMGLPIFEPKYIPTTFSLFELDVPYGRIILDNKAYKMYAAGMGNPHAIVYLDSLDGISLDEWGSLIETDKRFPNKTNVHFVQIVEKDLLILKVWERGAGKTLACGTGACATLAISTKLNLCNESAKILLPGGDLQIKWPNKSGPIYMSGPADYVFSGVFNI